MKSALFKSPIIGTFMLLIISLIYFLIYLVNYDSFTSVISQLIDLLKLIPLLTIYFVLISFTFSIPTNFFLYKHMLNNFRTEKFVINMAMFIGFILSIFIAILEYHYHQILAKSFFIVIGFSMMATINSVYFLVLSGIIKIKENKNDKKQGDSI